MLSKILTNLVLKFDLNLQPESVWQIELHTVHSRQLENDHLRLIDSKKIKKVS